jgi:hypothetical protein
MPQLQTCCSHGRSSSQVEALVAAVSRERDRRCRRVTERGSSCSRDRPRPSPPLGLCRRFMQSRRKFRDERGLSMSTRVLWYVWSPANGSATACRGLLLSQEGHRSPCLMVPGWLEVPAAELLPRPMGSVWPRVERSYWSANKEPYLDSPFGWLSRRRK